MFGGLTKTSSRIAIAAALGLTLGGFAFKATPAKAADLGGDCCADLEERVAELEATTVRKGNKKVSVTLSGWVVKSMNWWDDGHDSGFAVGDKDYDLGSRFAVTGSATISPGWSAGFNMTVTAGSDSFGIFSYQNDEFNSVNNLNYGSTFGAINTLYSFIWIKSDHWGTLNWGHLSPASDNPAVLADISGTVIESNFVGFEGPGFNLHVGKNNFFADAGSGYSSLTWGSFWGCDSGNAPGADCFGVAQPAVRYDSPTWGGFRFETSYGTATLVPELLDQLVCDYPYGDSCLGAGLPATQDSHFWDFAAFYTADWNSIKISLAGAYTYLESNPFNSGQEDIWQVGGSIMHKPSGLGIYATGNWEDVDSANNCGSAFAGQVPCNTPGFLFPANFAFSMPDTSMFGVKPFWRHTFSPLGATVIYGEYAEYYDYFGGAGRQCGIFGNPNFCTQGFTSSTLQRPGAGIVQEIDSAAMHVWFRWQQLSVDANYTECTTGIGVCFNKDEAVKHKLNADDWNLFQVGAVMFF